MAGRSGGASWESEWVRFLLSGLDYAEILDGKHRELHDGAIIVDNQIGPQRRPYYLEMLQRGNRFALIHLSDEHHGDDASVYNFANLVLRNYWSRAHAADKRVIGIPLGLMNGFKSRLRHRPSSGATFGASREIRKALPRGDAERDVVG
jgi:hypothetical protein